MNSRVLIPLFLLFWSITLPLSVHAELIFTAPPRESPEAGLKLYGPVANALSILLKEKVIYEHPRDWLTYSRRMREGDYDIVFDGPQFASWRMAHINHVPLVRIQGDLRFVIITNQNSGIQDIQDLATKKICALASPNLATLTILREFTNPVRQPMLVEGKGGMKGIYQRFKDGDCMAVILRDSFYKNKISDLERDEYRVVWESMRMPNQTITMTQVISREARDKVVKAFGSDQGAVSALPLFQRFSKKSTRFIVAEKNEYEDLNYLLEGVVWGW